ncbi:MAG: T9SS type A sorting domain-containing protein [Bacteroidales bacterium]
MKRFSMSFFPLVFLILLPAIVISQMPEKSSAPIPDFSSISIKKGISVPLVPDSGQILFQVDMSQWAAKGRFNPATDSIDMPGTFNNWAGSATLQKVDTTLVYQITLSLDSLTVQEFRFRINRDTNHMEFPNGGNRMFRVPGHSMIIKYMYNDFDTTAVPMTFKCHMYYQIKAHHFDPQPLKDYLDVADSMNSWSYKVLFDINKDSTYQLTFNIPRSLISPVIPIKFKFRINGDRNTSEFPNGGPFRFYFLHDTTGGFQNLVDAWYDDENPGILRPPWAYNLYIQGEYFVGQTLTGSYIYEDVNSKPEGNSIYKWYRADSLTQVNPELLTDSDSTINYVLDTLDYHKYIAFEVTPVAQGTGDSLIGKPVRTWTGLIVSVGIGELAGIKPGIYPNPVTSLITFTNMDDIQHIEIFSVLGQSVGTLETMTPGRVTYDASSLGRGIYFVKFSKPDHTFTTVKFIKN